MYTKKSGRMTFKSNRRPNFKRNSNYAPKGRNKGNVTQQYNKYLKLAKDTFSSGDRIQAEYYYQFTDHYYRLMLELGITLEDSDNDIDENKTNELSTSENLETEEAPLELSEEATSEEATSEVATVKEDNKSE